MSDTDEKIFAMTNGILIIALFSITETEADETMKLQEISLHHSQIFPLKMKQKE